MTTAMMTNEPGAPTESEREYFARARQFAQRIARARTGDAEIAEDIAQEVMLRLYQHPERPLNLEAWITRVVANRVNDLWRAQGRRPRGLQYEDISPSEAVTAFLSVPFASPSYMGVLSQYIDQIWDELGQVLSERELDVMRLTVAGVPQADIAEALGFAGPASVKTTLSRIRRKVRELGDERVAEWLTHRRPY